MFTSGHINNGVYVDLFLWRIMMDPSSEPWVWCVRVCRQNHGFGVCDTKGAFDRRNVSAFD